MLTIKAPIEIAARTGYLADAEAFCRRITGNYDLMETRLAPEDLMHLSTTPPEIYVAESGGMTSILQQSSRNETNIHKVEILNNVLNRILLSTEVGLTYQDRVYITDALYRLGIRDDHRFMRDFYQLAEETRNTNTLITLYLEHASELRELMDFRQEHILRREPGEGTEEGGTVRETRQLHTRILDRLMTGAVWQIVSNFNRDTQDNRIDAREYALSQQTYLSQQILLARLRGMAGAGTTELVYRSENRYEEQFEAGDVREDRVEQTLNSAVLLNLLQNLYHAGFERFYAQSDAYYHFEDAFYQVASQTIARIRQSWEMSPVSLRREGDRISVENRLAREEIQLLNRNYAREEGDVFYRELQDFYEENRAVNQWASLQQLLRREGDVRSESVSTDARVARQETVLYAPEGDQIVEGGAHTEVRGGDESQTVVRQELNQAGDAHHRTEILSSATEVENRMARQETVLYAPEGDQIVEGGAHTEVRGGDESQTVVRQELNQAGDAHHRTEILSSATEVENRMARQEITLLNRIFDESRGDVYQGMESYLQELSAGDRRYENLYQAFLQESRAGAGTPGGEEGQPSGGEERTVEATELVHEEDRVERMQELARTVDALNRQNEIRRRQYQELVSRTDRERRKANGTGGIQRTREDAALALLAPEVLRERLQRQEDREVVREQSFFSELTKLMPPEGAAAFEILQQYERDPQFFLQNQVIRSADIGEVLQDVILAQREEAPAQVPEEGEEALMVHPESVREPARTRPSRRSADLRPPEPVATVHRQTQSLTGEELEETLAEVEQRMSRQVRRDVREEIQQTERSVRAESTQSIQEVRHQPSAQDLQQLVDSGVRRQMERISDQVYRKLERKMRDEKARRGY